MSRGVTLNYFMYIEDLTPYVYLGRQPNPNVLAIGWLDAEHEFPKGPVLQALQSKLLACCFSPVNRTRGFHQSPFLKPSPMGYPVELDGKKMLLGSAEIRVPGLMGKSYVAPNLIYHYIKDCGYLPPKEFLDAVQAM